MLGQLCCNARESAPPPLRAFQHSTASGAGRPANTGIFPGRFSSKATNGSGGAPLAESSISTSQGAAPAHRDRHLQARLLRHCLLPPQLLLPRWLLLAQSCLAPPLQPAAHWEKARGPLVQTHHALMRYAASCPMQRGLSLLCAHPCSPANLQCPCSEDMKCILS